MRFFRDTLRRSLAALFALLLLAAPIAPGARAGSASSDCAGVVSGMVDAVNSGDLVSAQQAISPSMTVTLPNGLSMPLGGLAGLLPLSGMSPMGSGMPSLSIASLSPESPSAVDVTFAAGGGQVQARIQCSNGQITSLQLNGPPS